MAVTSIPRRAFPSITATGGDAVVEWADYETGVLWKSHVFDTSGNFAVTAGTGPADYLLAAGGGGGGGHGGTSRGGSGSGGAGGLLTGTVVLSPQTYVISIGAGGAGGTTSGHGSNGTNSTALGLTAVGGGGGRNSNSTGAGGAGGSAGGNYNRGNYSSAATRGQGYPANNNVGGGARGFGEGSGLWSWISGEYVHYCEGGSSGVSVNPGSTPIQNTWRPGSGGDAGNGYDTGQTGSGAAGSNGIFVIRYAVGYL